MGFKDQRKNDFYNMILKAENPGVEIVTVHSSTNADDEDPRQVWCKQTNPKANYFTDQTVEENKRVVLLRFGFDEAHEKGGIATPLKGLTIYRDGDAVPWQFNGQISQVSGHSHTLEFEQVAQIGAHGAR